MSRQTSSSAELEKLLASLMDMHPKKIDLSLTRIEKLLAKLDNPQKKLPPIFHIAGTNGKGSVFANIASILRAAGIVYHGYSSPHLVRFNERIIIKGNEVGDDDLIAALRQVMNINDGDEITFFEIITATAFWLFAKHPADILLCEVGLGGRLDSTNVISGEKMAIFTPIDLDHQEFLGDNIEKIALEKSGIITDKTHHSIITSPQRQSVIAILEKQAKKYGKDIKIVDYENQGGELVVKYYDGDINCGKPALLGEHQYMNGAVAVLSLMTFCDNNKNTLSISRDMIKAGISNVRWQGRLQKLSPAEFGMDEKCDMWLDGCHNAHGARAMVAWLRSLPAVKTALLFGLLENRDAKEFLTEFLPLDKHQYHFYPTLIGGDHQPHDPYDMAKVAKMLHLFATATPDWQMGLKTIAKGDYQRVIICGSLYLVGQVLSAR
ncbi:MAG: bifunctional folylpolyglutamate synthase/dihydrofolate synthase [Alphaproteobacteria bacterium]